MSIALVNGRIFTGETFLNEPFLNEPSLSEPSLNEQWLTNHAVIITGEKISTICAENELPGHVTEIIDLQGQRLIPGLIDTQVNGGGGVLFNDAPSVTTLQIMGKAHRQFGTTGFYPTLISDDLSVVAKAINAVEQAILAKVPGILGIHLEGPFLNPERKGVHDASKFKIIDEAAFELLTSLTLGKTLITIAPELTTPEMITRFVQAGVVVAAGHSAATYEQTKTALSAGLSSFTHLFNAMTPLTSRAPGMVGAALENTHSWCGIIADGHHVHPLTLKLAHQVKAAGKMILVTDAMPSVGAANKDFMLNGELIRCEDGKLSTVTGTLAGSDLNMLAAVKNAVELVGIDLAEAIRMASRYPAAMMGEKHLGEIKAGYTASLILIDDNFKLMRSWINGAQT
jgi:N-acetylglucosamine-6-phosphate deacetylase